MRVSIANIRHFRQSIRNVSNLGLIKQSGGNKKTVGDLQELGIHLNRRKYSKTPFLQQGPRIIVQKPRPELHELDTLQIDLQNRTDTILDTTLVPVGSFTTSTMEEAIDVMEAWMQLPRNPNQISNKQSQNKAADAITRILDRIIIENAEGNPSAYFRTEMAESVFLFWKDVSPQKCVYQILQILSKIRESEIVDERNIPYNNIISILTKLRTREAAQAVEGLLYRMISLEAHMLRKIEDPNNINTGSFPEMLESRCRVDIVTYNSAISSWMHMSQTETDAGERALRILNRMKGSYKIKQRNEEKSRAKSSDISYVSVHSKPTDLDNWTVVKPNFNSYSMVINTLLRSAAGTEKFDEAAFQAESLLQDLIYFDGESWQKDNNIGEIQRHFHIIMEALGQCQERKTEALEKAIELLHYMEKSRYDDLHPTTKTYNIILGMIGRLKVDRNSIAKMREILSDMKINQSHPNTQSMNIFLKATATLGDGEAAESILRQMEAEVQRGNQDMKPNKDTWNSVIEAYSKSMDHMKRGRKISILLNQMAHYGEKHPDAKPDKITMSIVLQSLVRKVSRGGSRRAGKEALNILNGMITSSKKGNYLMRPDKQVFTTVMNCIVKSGDTNAVNLVLDLLNRMQELRMEGYENLKPDTATMNTVLSAFAAAKSRGAAQQAEGLLEAMSKSSDKEVLPNTQSYTLLISAWAKSGSPSAVHKIEKLLNDMKKTNTAPNVFSFSNLLHAFAQSGDDTSYASSLHILKKMENGSLGILPNAYCYASVMQCISNTAKVETKVEKTMELLQRLRSFANSDEISGSYTAVFNTAIKNIERSHEKRKDQLTVQVLNTMNELHTSRRLKAPMNIRTYNAAIRACAFTSGSRDDKIEAFKTASNFLNQIRSERGLSPDAYTYPAIMRACEELLGREDEDLDKIKDIFEKCCEDGLVDALLLKNMINFLPNAFLQEILPTEKTPETIRLNDLPQQWRKSIYQTKAVGRYHKSRRNNKSTVN